MSYADAGTVVLDDIRGRLTERFEAPVRDFGMDVDLDRLVIGASPGGVAAFAPSRTLSSLTADDVATGARLGLALLAPRDTGEQATLPAGVYAVTQQFATDAPQGVAALTRADGTVAASTPVEVGKSMAHPQAARSTRDRVSVHVGDVTVTAGWLYVCFLWDDPPGTPGGVCHKQCYGWH